MTLDAPVGRAPARPVPGVWYRLRRQPTALLGLSLLGMAVLLAAFAPLIVPYSPTQVAYDALIQPPSHAHWFGTDDLGRDVLSRVVWGGRELLRVGLLGISVALLGGTAIGLVAGYWGGWPAAALMRGMDMVLAFPPLLLLLAVVAFLGPSLSTLIIGLGVTAMPNYGRLVRAMVLAIRQEDYILAAQVSGASPWRIVIRHIAPTIAGGLIVLSTSGLGSAISVAAGLSFLGLGAQPPSPEWGAMLNAGVPFLRDAWWLATFPGLALFLVVFSINLVGDGLRDALDTQ